MTPVNLQQAFKTSSQCQCIRSEGTLQVQGQVQLWKPEALRAAILTLHQHRPNGLVRLQLLGPRWDFRFSRPGEGPASALPESSQGCGGLAGEGQGKGAAARVRFCALRSPPPGLKEFRFSAARGWRGAGVGGGRPVSFPCPPAPAERGAEHALLKTEECLGIVTRCCEGTGECRAPGSAHPPAAGGSKMGVGALGRWLRRQVLRGVGTAGS